MTIYFNVFGFLMNTRLPDYHKWVSFVQPPQISILFSIQDRHFFFWCGFGWPQFKTISLDWFGSFSLSPCGEYFVEIGNVCLSLVYLLAPKSADSYRDVSWIYYVRQFFMSLRCVWRKVYFLSLDYSFSFFYPFLFYRYLVLQLLCNFSSNNFFFLLQFAFYIVRLDCLFNMHFSTFYVY